MDTTAVSIDPGRIHLPLRFIAEATGSIVEAEYMRPSAVRINVTSTVGWVDPKPPSWVKDTEYNIYTGTQIYYPDEWAKILRRSDGL